MKPKALYYNNLQYQVCNLELLNEYFNVITFPYPGQETDEILALAELVFAPLGFRVDAARMDKFPRLKVIVSNTTGVPHIDLLAAADRGVYVCALHDQQVFLNTITPTAEHTIGLLLAASRRTLGAHLAVTSGVWDRRPWAAPRMMSRLRIGLVGYGRLGRKVAKISTAMGMDVAWYDPYVKNERGKINDLIDLARRSDVLSLHAIANEETKGIVNRRVLESLPKEAIVINTARGELIDTDALLDLLETGHLWAAALDTLPGEYDQGFSDHSLTARVMNYARTHNNLIVTPHIGGSTIDAWTDTERHVILSACRLFNIF